ncbi:branched-chain amino acid ABC transporter permease [Halobacteriales archaeon SW_7_68_16]|nr:MAG: branched-chain amino acid ABC transporter permease [Halobacteriales archaeon SW_7_68_16]
MILGVMIGIYVLFALLGAVIYPTTTLVSGLLRTFQRVTFLTAVYALLVLALNLHWGYAGLFNIGVAGFMAVAVYAMAMLTNPPTADPPGLGVPGAFADLFGVVPLGIAPGLGHFLGVLVAIAAGTLVAVLVGAITALPALRLRADYLAIVTVALSEIIRLTLVSRTFQTFSIPLTGVELGTGAGLGISLPDNPVRVLYYRDPGAVASDPNALGDALFTAAGSLGVDESIVVNTTYTLFLIGVVVVFYWLLQRIGNSPFGRVLKAIREDESVARALGKDTRRVKIVVFALGCGLMGLAGILWEGSKGFTTPGSSTFIPLQTFYVFIALIIGGAGSNTGSVLGAALFAGLLFEAPPLVANVATELLGVSGNPGTFAAALATTQPNGIVAYAATNVFALRFVLVGVVLVLLMHRRPDGLLGGRKEIAASVDLGRPDPADGGDDGRE